MTGDWERDEYVQQSIGNAQNLLSARERFRDAVSDLLGTSTDPDTVSSILFYTDLLIMRKEQLEGGRGEG